MGSSASRRREVKAESVEGQVEVKEILPPVKNGVTVLPLAQIPHLITVTKPTLPPIKMPCCGPGYASPEAAQKGPRECVLFVTCPHVDDTKPDIIASVDVDPNSDTYCQVVSKVEMPFVGDELHHTGWNACSSCHDKPSAKRTHIIAPALNSDRVYVINVEDPKNIKLEKTIYSDQLKKYGVTFPHTSHCLADGNIMISTLGDLNGNNKGNFLLLDSKTFEPTGLWMHEGKNVSFNYDFWYQPRQNVMISTEWGSPNMIKGGFDPSHVGAGHYGNSVHIFEWDTHTLLETIELPLPQGSVPLEIRFHHDPNSKSAFVGTALGSSLFWIHETDAKLKYVAECVETIPPYEVENWALPEMPGLITDILLSMDDRYLISSCWFHGDMRNYDITDPKKPKLVGQIYLGGLLHTESGVKVKNCPDFVPPEPLVVKGRRIDGGPQMLQMSLDGKRVYVTMSLYRKWDAQFYPGLMKNGSVILRVDVGEDGSLTLNQDFLVDFGALPGGPYLGHEMRYPGGDCTSDIWV